MSTTQSTQQSDTRIVNGRVFHVTHLATARDTNTRYAARDHVALVRAGRRPNRDAWLDERDPNANLAAWDDLHD